MNKQPATAHQEIVDKINHFQGGTVRYLCTDDLEYRRILKECEKLIQASPHEGYVAQGMARVLACDEEAAERDFKNAARLSPGDEMLSAEYAHCQFLVNIGRYSKALPLFRNSARPVVGGFGIRHSIAPALGAVRWLNDAFIEADEMHLEYESTVNRDLIKKSAEFLASINVTDDRLAEIYDLVGDVARDHNVRLGRYTYGVGDFEGVETYVVKHFVDIDPDEAADMTSELCWKLAGRDDIPSQIHIGFEVG